MSVLYADSSALAKLLVAERESAALAEYVQGNEVVASELVEAELRRLALRAVGVRALPLAERLLARVSSVALTTALLRQAGALLPPELRTLDAIHLATALSLGPLLDEFLCYDARLASAASAAGFSVVAPT